MSKIIITSHEELAMMIDSAILKGINPIKELINSELNPKKKNVTVKEAAKLLNVCEETIRNYIKKGTISASKIGRRIVINVASLENKLQEFKSLKYRR